MLWTVAELLIGDATEVAWSSTVDAMFVGKPVADGWLADIRQACDDSQHLLERWPQGSLSVDARREIIDLVEVEVLLRAINGACNLAAFAPVDPWSRNLVGRIYLSLGSELRSYARGPWSPRGKDLGEYRTRADEIAARAEAGDLEAVITWARWVEWVGSDELAERHDPLRTSWRRAKAWPKLSDITTDSSSTVSPSSDSGSSDDLETLFAELDSLIGLLETKEEVRSLTNLLRVQKLRKAEGLASAAFAHHLVFVGPPGTGKTTVARLVGRIYKALGVLAKGHLVECGRQDLVAEYVGQTAVKTSAVIDSAMDGVLFIDEAYSLSRPGAATDFGAEAIEVLLKRMEDDRERLVVIVAGYENEMAAFISSNPGLASRFGRRIHFPSYSDAELDRIFERFVAEYGYRLDESVRPRLRDVLAKRARSERFGNARAVRNYVERAATAHANRLAANPEPDASALMTLTSLDLPNDFET